MEEEIIKSYGGGGVTVLHPFVLWVILIAGALLLLLPRRYAIVPLLFAVIFIPMSQRVVISGLDFMVLRILILFGWIRIIMRSEFNPIKLNTIDKVLILWVLSSVASYTLLWQTWGAFINRLGFAYNAIGIYFLFRFLVRDFGDVERLIKALAIISVIVAICVLVEQVNGRNLFSIFGGVPEFTPERAGRLRSQGAFGHSILAGMFGAMLMPLFVSLWMRGRDRLFAIAGAVSATIITVASASSGPWIAYLAGMAALCMWPFRDHMRLFRWGVVFGVVALHIAMKAPVWALIGRVGVVAGSSAYHRYYLVDQFIRRIDEWWLIGTKSTDRWGWMMWDHANQYVSEGITAGLLTLVLFIAVIACCFRGIGLAIRAAGKRALRLSLWALGAALFANVVGLMGISYWDQMILVWYLLLAMISSMSVLSDRTARPDPVKEGIL
jgi:hypothetical protein